MPRMVRISVSGVAYHVTQRGKHRHTQSGRPLTGDRLLEVLERQMGKGPIQGPIFQ